MWKNDKFTVDEKKFRQINFWTSFSNLFSKTVTFTKFLEKNVRVFRKFLTVGGSETQKPYRHDFLQKILSYQLFLLWFNFTIRKWNLVVFDIMLLYVSVFKINHLTRFSSFLFTFLEDELNLLYSRKNVVFPILHTFIFLKSLLDGTVCTTYLHIL